MSKEEFLKIQTCVLKVNIHCDGCKHKVKKILQKIDGVYTLKIDAEQGKVTVSGNVDPFTLIKKLAKSGKHAEIWGSKPSNNFQNQFKNMQIDHGKSGNKNQKGGGPPNLQQVQQLQQMKGFQDLKLPQLKDMKMPLNPTNNQNLNNKKVVKFDLSDDDDDLTDDEFDDFDDDEDDFDDEDDDEDDMSHVHHQLNKMKPVIGNGSQGPNMMMLNGMMNAQAKKGSDPFDGGNKKGGGNGGGLPVQMNGFGKNGNGGKQGGGGNQNHGGGFAKEGGKKGGGDAKSGHNGGGSSNKNGHNGNGGGPNGAKKDGAQPMNMVNQLGNMNMPMGPIPAFQGRPAVAGGGVPLHGAQLEGMGGNQYQQQLAAAMMNQQRAMGNERFQPMMYARPPPAVNYAPQYPYPYQYQHHQSSYPPPADPYTNFFNDENTSSCNVM